MNKNLRSTISAFPDFLQLGLESVVDSRRCKRGEWYNREMHQSWESHCWLRLHPCNISFLLFSLILVLVGVVSSLRWPCPVIFKARMLSPFTSSRMRLWDKSRAIPLMTRSEYNGLAVNPNRPGLSSGLLFHSSLTDMSITPWAAYLMFTAYVNFFRHKIRSIYVQRCFADQFILLIYISRFRVASLFDLKLYPLPAGGHEKYPVRIRGFRLTTVKENKVFLF